MESSPLLGIGLEELTRSGELTDARLHHAQAMMAQATDFRREWSQRGADRWLPVMEAELANHGSRSHGGRNPVIWPAV